MNTIAAIKNATCLHTLMDALNNAMGKFAGTDFDLGQFIDLGSLQTFGGSDIVNTDGVYSWDETFVLTYDNGFQIEPRDEKR